MGRNERFGADHREKSLAKTLSKNILLKIYVHKLRIYGINEVMIIFVYSKDLLLKGGKYEVGH
ncbi:MAG: hypothetical protein Q4A75_08425 [Peptostreptococcaceae bacterium]|nr:hypothetical protein [Peptostreptococcaceae bacterium]